LILLRQSPESLIFSLRHSSILQVAVLICCSLDLHFFTLIDLQPMKTTFITSCTALLLGLSAAGMAHANSSCDKPTNDFDGLYCLNKVYIEADKELNENYKKLVSKLDTSGKSALKTGQLAWIRERNSSCSKNESDGFYVNLNCATDKTISRAQFLQDRVRECTSAGCQNSKLQ
jgi:uncharacterized protein YecT (DUF1311 family)